jgi:hypothetical protein
MFEIDDVTVFLVPSSDRGAQDYTAPHIQGLNSSFDTKDVGMLWHYPARADKFSRYCD